MGATSLGIAKPRVFAGVLNSLPVEEAVAPAARLGGDGDGDVGGGKVVRFARSATAARAVKSCLACDAVVPAPKAKVRAPPFKTGEGDAFENSPSFKEDGDPSTLAHSSGSSQ